MAIDIKDLRVGSYVKDEDGEICKVTSIITNSTDQERICFPMFLGTVFLSNQTFQSFEYLRPIPITEEILLKLGFIKVKEYFIHEKDKLQMYAHIRLALIQGKCHCSIGDDEFGILLGVYSSVYEIQNLYHSLSKTELILKD